MGNPFKFYTYTGIERKVSFTLTAYALSQLELITMWSKLDFLSHLAYPFNVTTDGASPSLFYFTLGNLFHNKPAILTTLTYNIDDDKQIWEIGGSNAKIKRNNFEKSLNNKSQISSKGNLSVDTDNFETYIPFHKKFEYIDQSTSQTALENNTERSFELNESSISKTTRTNINNIEYNSIRVGNSNVSMDTYKVPKMISIQLEITFLETSGTTSGNLYATGESINGGVVYKPSGKPRNNKNDKKKEYKEDKRTIQQTYQENPEWIPGGGFG